METRQYTLIDSNLIIGLLRSETKAKSVLDSFDDGLLCISEITEMEVLIGCNTVKKRKEVEEKLGVYNIVDINRDVIEKTISLIKRYSHTRLKNDRPLMLADTMIAASAIHYNLPLLTFNKKDFDFIKELTLHPDGK